MTIDKHFEVIELIFARRFNSKDAQEACADTVGPLLNLIRFLIPFAEDRLYPDDNEVLQNKIEEILSSLHLQDYFGGIDIQFNESMPDADYTVTVALRPKRGSLKAKPRKC